MVLSQRHVQGQCFGFVRFGTAGTVCLVLFFSQFSCFPILAILPSFPDTRLGVFLNLVRNRLLRL